jgi:hypothetical protein
MLNNSFKLMQPFLILEIMIVMATRKVTMGVLNKSVDNIFYTHV